MDHAGSPYYKNRLMLYFNLFLMGDYFFNYTTIEFQVTNLISLVCASLVFFYIIWLRITKPIFVSRVTLKIQMAIAFVDILRHLNNIFNYVENHSACAFLGFFLCFLFHINTYLNFAIALNLHKTYLHETIPSDRFTYSLYILPYIAALIVDLIPFAYDAYGAGLTSFCFFKAKGTFYEAMKVLVFYVTNYPFIIYCLYVPLAIMLKQYRTEPDSVPTDPESQLLIGAQDPLSRTLVLRVSLYPLACFLCHTGSIAFDIYVSIYKEATNFLGSWCFLGLSINGAVNMLCFLIDPFILESFNPPNLTLIDDPEGLSDNEEDSESHNIINEDSDENLTKEHNEQGCKPKSSDSSNPRSEHNMQGCIPIPSSSNNPRSDCYIERDRLERMDPHSRYYTAPIAVPHSSSLEEWKKKGWHTSDMHLHPKFLFKN